MHKVGTKGQVVITKEIRDRLGIEPGWEALQRIVDGHVELYFFPPADKTSARGILAPYITRTIDSEEEFHEACEEAWAAAAREDERRRREDL